MELLNTLYVQTQRAYLHLDHDTVRVDVERKTTLRVPLIHLQSLVCFGDVLVSPSLIHRCGEDGRSVVMLDRNGRFKARIEGPVSGNVLLRREQHLALSDDTRAREIARNIVAGKIQNSRIVLLRAARESTEEEERKRLQAAAASQQEALTRLTNASDIDIIRGCEGDSARAYFDVFGSMVRTNRDIFYFRGRNRRPPLDPMNAALSFVYALVRGDCVSALESTGLDPQVGYLHALRPGRPALALDLMEEFRPMLADRLVLSLINRRQLNGTHFEEQPGGAVFLTEDGRRVILTAYQKRKQEVVRHRLLDRSIPVGLSPHLQARLLARHLRGDIDAYVPMFVR